MKPFPFERDPVIEAYKRDVDRTLLRENLKRTVDERLAKLEAMARWHEECQRALKARRGLKND